MVEQVMREKSAAREVSLPRELASRLVSLSRADISQVMCLLSGFIKLSPRWFCLLSGFLNCSVIVIHWCNHHLSGAAAKLRGLGWGRWETWWDFERRKLSWCKDTSAGSVWILDGIIWLPFLWKDIFSRKLYLFFATLMPVCGHFYIDQCQSVISVGVGKSNF